MIQIRTYYTDKIDVWRSYFNRLPLSCRCIYNSPEYLLFLEKKNFGKAVCQIFERDDLFIYFPAFLRSLPFSVSGYDLTSSWYYGGPLSSFQKNKPVSSEWMKAIIRGRSGLGAVCEFIRCDPNLKNHRFFESPFEVKFERPTVIVNLKNSWNEIVTGFSSQNKRNLKKAEKCGLDVCVDGSISTWKEFGKIYQEEMLRKRAPGHLRFDEKFFVNLSDLNGFTLFTIKLKKKIIGGFISAHGADIAHHFLSAVRYDYWDKRPNNLLFTQVLKHFFKNNYKLFDFQGGRKGVYRFKKNFSSDQNQFYVATCIYDKKKFNNLNKKAGRPAVSYFPPYRAAQ